MIKHTSPVEGPVFDEGETRLLILFNSQTLMYSLYLIATDGTSNLVVENIGAFEIEEALDWYSDEYNTDARALADKGREAYHEALQNWTAELPEKGEEVEAV